MLETRIRLPNKAKAIKRLGPNWSWSHNYEFSPKGRIWVGWKAGLSVLLKHEQFVHCWIELPSGQLACFVTFIYGLHSVDSRKPLWSQLKQLAQTCSPHPWLVVGDFNAMLYSTDRVNGSEVSEYETRDFAECLDSCQLFELRNVGCSHSWTNKDQIDFEFGLLYVA